MKLGLHREAVRSYTAFLQYQFKKGILSDKTLKLLEAAQARFAKATVVFKAVSTPSGAELSTADGAIKGRTALVERIRPGKHEIVLHKKGFKTVRKRIFVQAGRPYTLKVTLEKVIVPVSFVLKVEESGAVISIDGKEMGRTPLAKPLKLMPGPHWLKIVHPGYHLVKKRIALRPGILNEMALKLIPLRPVNKRGVPFIKKKGPIVIPIPSKPSRAKRTWGWVTLGVGIAAAIAGTTHAILARRTYNRLMSGHDIGDDLRYNTVAAQGVQHQALSIIEFSIGGAALLTSLVLFLVDRKANAPKPVSFSLMPYRRGARFEAYFRF